MKKNITICLLVFMGFFLGAQDIALDSTVFNKRAAVVLEETDTVFFLYDRIHGYKAGERASYASKKIMSLIKGDDFEPDSFKVKQEAPFLRIVYQDELIANISEIDAAWFGKTQLETAENYRDNLIETTSSISRKLDVKSLLVQIGLAILVVIISGFIIRYVNRFFKFLAIKAERFRGVYIQSISIRNYEFVTEERLMTIVKIVINIIRILFIILLFYLTLPILFSIFPWTEGIATQLINYVLNPAKKMVMAVVNYIPNLFTILVIYMVIRYITKGVSFMASEIEAQKLNITNFYPDWAKPTARIINFMLYTFMMILIWPYLPGSDSDVFKGVSVFFGLLISLGSSSAISNIVAGLVITYMRPYRVGDRVKIGETTGDVVEKNLLVTRVKTIKNEVITVPNSSVLSNSSVNYSQSSQEQDGLVIHTTVTIGYDVPWRKVHAMLLEAVKQTPFIKENPAPFVLQTSLDDFYVSYQVNAYTDQPSKQSLIYSDLHALIQDVFQENNVEIMSPHYRAEREGPSTIPTGK